MNTADNSMLIAWFKVAFSRWEEEYRANPETFMDAAAVGAMDVSDVSELRARYFADLCHRVKQ